MNSHKSDYTPYHPERISVPPLFVWPPQPVASLRWIFFDLLAPWGFFWIALAVVIWQFLTPTLGSMRDFSFIWMLQLWVRNAVILICVAGGLHWWFYIKPRATARYQVH